MYKKFEHIIKKPFQRRNRLRSVCAVCLVIALWTFWFCLPEPLFDDPYSTVLEDRHGRLLGAKIADDGQWRFPLSGKVPRKFEKALLEYEDQRFYSHPGVDPLSVVRAAIQNIRAGHVVSGASTISMQVIRLSRKDQPRTFTEKLIEMMMALRLEIKYSKKEILALYTAHAPFGGNVVGLEAAAWRYFGRAPAQLSWAESATLAVLPNSPALIHPGRNRDQLQQKRDRLLGRLQQEGMLDSLDAELARAEPLPREPVDLPQIAPHLLDRVYTGQQKGTKVRTTINSALQKQVNQVVHHHHKDLKQNQIYNAAAVVAKVNTGEVLAYVGNTQNEEGEGRHGSRVDVITSPRSTGSILKPFLYTLMLDEGELLPNMLVPDIPTQISDYSPKNFSRSYDGAVPANEALSRSLNVPAVRMLQDFGVPRFHYYLQQMGMTTLNNPPEHYGLSLILGGSEGTLWDITGMYASLARLLNNYDAADRLSRKFISEKLHYREDSETRAPSSFEMSPAAVWFMLEAMLDVKRPGGELNWRTFTSSRKVAWKTGTSFGYRDGWAIGITPEYVVGVWVGNADGEGRPGLIGVKTAGPVLFDLFNLLDETTWFSEPIYEMEEVPICSKSGYRAGAYCSAVDIVAIPKSSLETASCPFHHLVHLNQSQNYQVSGSCASVDNMHSASWFVLPPVQEWYYRRNHPSYEPLPPFSPGCDQQVNGIIASMELIYPRHSPKIYVPLELDGSQSSTVFEVAHRISGNTVYWHLDENYLGKTERNHQMALSPEPGKHILTLVDEQGAMLKHRFEILSR